MCATITRILYYHEFDTVVSHHAICILPDEVLSSLPKQVFDDLMSEILLLRGNEFNIIHP